MPLSGMAAKIPWKSLSKQDTLSSLRGAFSSFSSLQEALSTKRGMFIAGVSLVVVVGLLWRVGDFFNGTEETPKAPVTIGAPPPPAAPAPTATAPAPTTAAPAPPTATPPAAQPAEPVAQPQTPETATAPDQQVEQTGETEHPDQGTILVSKRPVEVMSAPSATASAMYGFPAGRPFRVIGREGSFTHIQDVESGAKGWIDEAALALPPRGPGGASAPSQAPATGTRVTGSADPKPKATKRDGQWITGSEPAAEPAQTRKRPGLFGGGGPFRGLFGGGN